MIMMTAADIFHFWGVGSMQLLTTEDQAELAVTFLLSEHSFDDPRYTPGELEQFRTLPYRALRYYEPIRRLFEKLGFELIGRCPHYYFEGEDRLIYYLKLPLNVEQAREDQGV
jgi:hypothetical protein